jgi:hypothetical protein
MLHQHWVQGISPQGWGMLPPLNLLGVPRSRGIGRSTYRQCVSVNFLGENRLYQESDPQGPLVKLCPA